MNLLYLLIKVINDRHHGHHHRHHCGHLHHLRGRLSGRLSGHLSGLHRHIVGVEQTILAPNQPLVVVPLIKLLPLLE